MRPFLPVHRPGTAAGAAADDVPHRRLPWLAVAGARLVGRTLLAVAVIPAVSACASITFPPASTRAELARADRLLSIGCYACLKEATQIYERARGRGPARAAIAAQAHQALVLMALRERELGLPASNAAQRAVTPETLPADVFDHVLRIVGEPQHLPDGEADALAAAMAPLIQTLSNHAARSLPAAYALAAVSCRTSGDPADQPSLSRWREESAAIRYADLMCAPDVSAADVEALLGADPRFLEVHYLAGMHELQQGRPRSAYHQVAKASEAFPKSFVVNAALAHLALAIDEAEEALRLYERALASRDDPASTLGRARALTFLDRHEEAIDVLNGLLETGAWSPGEAHYWRGWNLYQLARHEEAREDARQALRTWSSPDVERLAGLTSLALDRPDEARGHFVQALALGADDCESRLHLARLDSHAHEWATALDGFDAAATCFSRALAERQEAVSEHEALASTVREISRLERWRASSLYSAAISAKVLGRRELALAYASRLIDDPELGALARDFIYDIDVPASPTPPAQVAPGG
jgi:tetratricopeptide (TPR) repeat protein